MAAAVIRWTNPKSLPRLTVMGHTLSAGPPARPFPVRPPVPEPPATDPPWYALLKAFRSNALLAWTRNAYEAPILERRVLGRPSLLLNAPAAIRRVLVDNDANYSRTPAGLRILRPVVGARGLLLSRGEAWRRQRRTLAPAFAPRTLPLLARHAAVAADLALARLDAAAAAAGGRADLLAFFQALTLDIAGRAMFSLEMDRHGAELRGMIARYNRSLGRPHLSDFLLPAGLPNLWDLGRARFRRRWMGLIQRILDARREAGGGSGVPRDLLDLLTGAVDPETGGGLSPDELRDQVATLIMAGHETTALALFWACWLLVLAPDVQERVAEEAGVLQGGPAAVAGAVPQLVHTRAVVQEALRLYPPAYTILRFALDEDHIDGHRVAPGAIVAVAPWILHRHRRLWDDPDAFLPERFLPGAPPPDRFAYLPFGAGPRVCIGAPFALTEATLVLARLVGRFRLAMPAGAPPILPAPVVTTQPDHAAAFLLTPRARPS